ncbi:biotin synthase [Clostridium acetireducens DSM 10703]|uniref:Biotin synthase n=1 Tax=Clostridium acetireducens DSM 10703 TaxID=1121290 RepID=A0A1E8EYU2_9CLOT|nr:[FeFe] hydrogenase H-cluster radical SAM maturase HydE [Clostridium acetireducens]OFI05862.1 biotin synthase [Clostridium acetireducens DSM 10703]
MSTYKLIDNIVNGYKPNLEEVKGILDSSKDETEYLFNAADNIKKEIYGNEIHLRGIIEFSNYCRCLCEYCGLNGENNGITRYRMELDEIIENAKEAIDAGYKTIVLQSGEDLWYTKDKITYLIKEIKKLGDIAITLSVGERHYEEYKAWREAGADRFLIKHETADEKLYNKLHPHSSLKNRVQALKWLRELGYEAGSGFMIGLPYQTTEIIAKDILLLKELGVAMAGIGPFIPHPLTKLGNFQEGSILMTLKAVALSRIIIKKINLPATTALGVLAGNKVVGDGESDFINPNLPFKSGANVLMKKVEPYKYRALYDIYPKKQPKIKTILEERKETEEFIESMGFKVGKTKNPE